MKKKKKLNWLISISQLMIISICVGAGYVMWLDYRIHSEFEGRKWTVPARVYARPLDIFLGQNLSRNALDEALRGSNYQSVTVISGPGQYRWSGNSVEIFLRAFDFWDGHFVSGRYRLELSDDQVNHIEASATSELIPVLRLEPELIGKIYPDHNEDRNLLSVEEVPDFLIKALIAVEDKDFNSHSGVDIRGIFRAFWVNFRSGELEQGGSTLTQQLVKNFFLTQERTITRKFNEIIMAILLERRYEKSEILLAYINEIYLGQNGAQAIHGFGSAAEFYFNKPLSELRDDQIALLVALVRGASYYNPQRNSERALSRRNLVLRMMAGQQYLGDQALAVLQTRPLDISINPGRTYQKNLTFLDLAKRQLLNDYNLDDLKNDGLRIHTTINPSIQNKLENTVDRQLSHMENQHKLAANSLESASVIVNISNGEVLAISGGRQRNLAGFNRALDAKRPVGSLIKPFIYLTALSIPTQYNLLSVVEDTAISLPQPDGSVWQPDNYDKTVHGSVSLMESLINSYNLATVNLGFETGVDKVVATLANAGMVTRLNVYPSLLLGAVGLSPFEVTQMYQSLANGGFRVPLNAIREVLDNQGNPLQRRELKVVQSLDSQAAFLTSYLLSRVVDIGTAGQLSDYFGDNYVVAGKTGTTNESRDSWFAGYDDEILAVTWLGRDDNLSTIFTGATGAMQIWAETMRSISTGSLTLVGPASIAWTDELTIMFEGNCTNIGRIPYVMQYIPENKLACQIQPDSIRSRFNPLNWFN